MRKIIILISMTVALLVTTTACGTQTTTPTATEPASIAEVAENEVKETTTTVEEETINTEAITKDENFYTVMLDGIKYQYEYQSDKIVSIKAYIEFNSAEEAEEAANVYRKNGLEDGVKDVYSTENILVIESDESELTKITVDELETLYQQKK